MEYQSFEERPDGDWVLFLCKAAAPQCWSARLFPTLDRAKTSYGNTCKSLFNGPAEIAKRWGGADMLEAYRLFNSRLSCRSSLKGPAEGPHSDDLPDEVAYLDRGSLAIKLWELIQRVGDRVSGVNTLQEDDDEEMFIIRLDRMTTDGGQVLIQSFNKQKRIVAEELLRFGKSKALEHELKTMMVEAVTSGRLKTKQDAWRIFNYYAPELGDCGYLYYPSKRHKQQDYAQNS